MEASAADTAAKPTSGISPFRYPGGKAWLAETLADELLAIAPDGGTYLEPYAGGAGAAIRLLASGAADEIYLNDADPRIYSAWASLLGENARFQEKLTSVEPTISQWWECKRIVDEPHLAEDAFELGFAAYFLNRTNRSGILQGAAPIGGYEQAGDWKLDARWYRETMLSRVRWLGDHLDRIHVSQLDGLAFLKQMASRVNPATSLFFVDPPYVTAGSRLYMNGMSDAHHRALAEYLCGGTIDHWVATYDDSHLIRDLYSAQSIQTHEIRYTLHRKRTEREILIRRKR